MLEAHGLESMSSCRESLEDLYSKLSLKRKREVFAVKMDKRLLAIIVVNISDYGLNLSNFTNCITAIVIDKDAMTPEALRAALVRMTQYYENSIVPVLIYPERYAIDNGLKYEKTYNLWVASSSLTDTYQEYMNGLLSRSGARLGSQGN